MPTFLQDNRMLAWVLAGVAFLVAFVLILKIVEIAMDLRRRLPRGARSRQLRLGFVESFDLDGERQLMLVRRDNIEHLLMIGGPNDVLIESGILRAEPRDGRFPRSSAEHNGAPHHAPPAPAAAEVTSPPPVPPLAAALAPAAFARPSAPEAMAGEGLASLAPLAPDGLMQDRLLQDRVMNEHLSPESAPPAIPAAPSPAASIPAASIPAASMPAAPVFAPPAPEPAVGAARPSEPAAQIAAILNAPPPVAPEPVTPPAPRFPLPPRLTPSRGVGSAAVPPRFAPPAPGAEAPPRPRFVAPTFARRVGADKPAGDAASAAGFAPLPPFPTPESRSRKPETAPEARPPVAEGLTEPPFRHDVAQDTESRPAFAPEPAPSTPVKDDLDFEPLDTLEEEMAKLLGRPLNK